MNPILSARLAGKTALVTAAGQGIGRASALAFADAGASVIATDIDANALQSLVEEKPAIITCRLDVTDTAQIAACRDLYPDIDVLMSCAGMVPSGSILDCERSEWDRALTLNVTAMYEVIRGWLPRMVARKAGSIIPVASVASSIRGVPNRFAYGVTKAAVIGLAKSVAADFVADGIRCNAICPGTIETPSLRDRLAATGDATAARAQFTARQPMGRLGTAAEVAALAVYLASDEAAFTTGAVHVIDGGWTM